MSHSRSILSRPICSYSSAWRASASAAPTRAPLANTVSAPASSCFFQPWMRVGWTPNWLANSLTVRSPLTAANATWALNAAVCCFRFTVIVTPFLGHQSSLAGGPVFGVHYTDEVTAPSSRREWCRVMFAIQDFDHVNRCAWFDYQRDKVYLRTSQAVRRACRCRRKRRKRAKAPVSREIQIKCGTCPRCKGKRITRLSKEMHFKFAYDLKFTAGGIHRQVIRCTTARHLCEDCNLWFLPKRFKRLDKHLHGLKSWAMYQHVVHRISFQHLEAMFEDCFGLRVSFVELHMLKSLVAGRYRPAWKRILDRIAAGGLAHADETHVNLQKGKGYVWALTNLEDVFYMYRPGREADFLQDLLRGFKGVLVTDFYTGYDSLPCDQQKCLVHLIRDFNGDLLANPYDEEFKALAGEFGKLLRPVIETVDKYGLTRRHLHKHKAEVVRFFRALESRVCRSELTEAYQKRLLKNERKLFTFLDHDGVPWNNNYSGPRKLDHQLSYSGGPGKG